jgi:phospholipid-translocating ATPase
MLSRRKDSEVDSGSDLDFDLQELDPFSSSGNHGRSSLQGLGQEVRKQRRADRQRPGRIELQTFRGDSARRHRDYGKAYDGLAADENQRDEDLEGLLNDEDLEDERQGLGGYHRRGDSDVPLFQNRGYGRAKKWAEEEGTKSGLGSRIRLPNFASFTKRPQSQPPISPSEEEEDHDPLSTRTVQVGQRQTTRYPPNAVSNAKYTPWSFLPLTLYNEFSFFFNLYFLLVALSQIIPALRIGYLSTYIAPLAFVLAITLGKEALDDMARRRRDADANAETYTTLEIFAEDDGPSGKDYKRKKLRTFTNSRARTQLIEYLPAGSETETQGIQQSAENDQIKVFEVPKKSKDLKVGDILKMGKDMRVPADVVILQSRTNETSVAVAMRSSADPQLLQTDETLDALDSNLPQEQPPKGEPSTRQDTSNQGGETFLRTDQLDGETDWKLRLATPLTQSLDMRQFKRLRISAGKPDKKVNEFIGTLEFSRTGSDIASPSVTANAEDLTDQHNDTPESAGPRNITSVPLGIDNTAWANTVLASNSTTLAVVVYTGRETRQALSTAPSRSKTGLLEYEINALTKILCILTLSISVVLVGLEGFESTPERKWYVAIMRFLILFSTIIPISLRVNLDMGKTVYAWFMERDQGIKGTVVRTSTIPEDLGRIEYLLSDKTGTLTQNGMDSMIILKKVD